MRELGDALRQLGMASMLFPCCWYLETSVDASAIKLRLAPVFSNGDPLVVVDATNHEAAWTNIWPHAAKQIKETWANGALPSHIRGRGIED